MQFARGKGVEGVPVCHGRNPTCPGWPVAVRPVPARSVLASSSAGQIGAARSAPVEAAAEPAEAAEATAEMLSREMAAETVRDHAAQKAVLSEAAGQPGRKVSGLREGAWCPPARHLAGAGRGLGWGSGRHGGRLAGAALGEGAAVVGAAGAGVAAGRVELALTAGGSRAAQETSPQSRPGWPPLCSAIASTPPASTAAAAVVPAAARHRCRAKAACQREGTLGCGSGLVIGAGSPRSRHHLSPLSGQQRPKVAADLRHHGPAGG